jgi:hypothetical protein
MWETLFWSCWSFFMFCYKFCELITYVIASIIMQSLKLDLHPRVLNSSTLDFQNFQQLFITPIVDNACYLLPPFTNNVMVIEILLCIPMTLSMLGCFCWITMGWCKVMGKTIAWNSLELIKINNQAYHKFVTLHGLKRCFLHEWYQIEINYLQDFLEWYDTFESFENVESYANEDLFFSLGLLI